MVNSCELTSITLSLIGSIMGKLLSVMGTFLVPSIIIKTYEHNSTVIGEVPQVFV